MSWQAKIGRKIGQKIGWLARRERRCPPQWELTRAASVGVDPRLERHLATCELCSAEYRALLAFAAKVEAAFPPPEEMSPDSHDAIAARLRAAAPLLIPRPRRWASLWVAAPIAALVGVATVWGFKHAPTSRVMPGTATTTIATSATTTTLTESRASIRAIGRARFARTKILPDEIVHLDEGSIELEVAPLHVSERFRVLTEDGEVEVRGTSFKVTASNHSLVAVHVWRGRVEVRSLGGAFAVLDAGDDWVRGAPASPSAPGTTAVEVPDGRSPSNRQQGVVRGGPSVSAPSLGALRLHRKTPNATRGLASAAATADLPATPIDPRPKSGTSFDHAWLLLRQGDARGAAAEFAEIERLARGRDIEEDALYWRAVATARAGDTAAARRLFFDFLNRFPASSRAGEAAAGLGWLLLDSGDPRAARRAFERAARDTSPRVRATAQEGLRRTQAEDR